MDHRTRVRNAVLSKAVDRPPFDLFDEAGYLFSDGRRDPSLRLGLSLEQQIEARLRFHWEFDTDLIFDAPVIEAGESACRCCPAPGVAERYGVSGAHFTVADERAGAVAAVAAGVCPEPWRLRLFAERLDPGADRPGRGPVRNDRLSLQPRGYSVGPGAGDHDFSRRPRVRPEADGVLHRRGHRGRARPDPPRGRGVRVGGAWTSLLGPEMCRELVLPYHRRVAAALRASGRLTLLHCCGRVSRMLEAYAEAGGLEPLTPPPLGDTALSDAKGRVGDRVCLKGNLDPVHVMLEGDLDSVARAARDSLATGAAGGGCILSVADCMAPGTPKSYMEIVADLVHACI